MHHLPKAVNSQDLGVRLKLCKIAALWVRSIFTQIEV